MAPATQVSRRTGASEPYPLRVSLVSLLDRHDEKWRERGTLFGHTTNPHLKKGCLTASQTLLVYGWMMGLLA